MQKELEERYATWEEFLPRSAAGLPQQAAGRRAQRDFADSEKFETLRALPFFDEFSDVEIWEVVRFSDWDGVAPGTLIMKDGEPGDYFCFLAEGELTVTKSGKLLDIARRRRMLRRNGRHQPADTARGADVVAQTPPSRHHPRRSAAARLRRLPHALLPGLSRRHRQPPGAANARLASV